MVVLARHENCIVTLLSPHHSSYVQMNIHFFFIVPPFAPREALQSWQEKNHKWLELTDVHKETHSNIRITVMPFYMGTKVYTSILLCYNNILKGSNQAKNRHQLLRMFFF